MPLKPHNNRAPVFNIPESTPLQPVTEEIQTQELAEQEAKPLFNSAMNWAGNVGNTTVAAFRQSNDVVNLADWLTNIDRDQGAYDPSFDVKQRLNDDEMWDNYRQHFLGVENEAEYLHRYNRIKTQQTDQQTLAEAGAWGMVANMGAAVLSPVSFIPLTMGAKSAKVAFTQGMALGALGGAVQEGVLFANQETRTAEDAITNVMFTAIAGGLLGSGAHYLSGQTAQTVGAAIRRDVDLITGGRTSSAGADVVAGVSGELAPSFGLAKAAAKIGNVVAQNAVQESSKSIKKYTALLSDGGMDYADYAKGVGVKGGNVEANLLARDGQFYENISIAQDLYTDYAFAGNAKGKWFANTRAVVGNQAKNILDPSSEILTAKQFRQEAYLALARGEKHPVPQINELADMWNNMIKQIGDEAEQAGLIKKLDDTANATYLPTMYDLAAINSDTVGFVNKLEGYFEAEIRAAAEKLTKKIEEQGGKNWQRNLEDILREWGIDDVQINAVGRMKTLEDSYRALARELANDSLHKIRGDTITLPRHGTMTTIRGAMQTRVLNLNKNEFSKWLITDINEVMHKYQGMMIPDIELNKKGINYHNVDEKGDPVFLKEIFDEEGVVRDRVAAELKAQGKSEADISKAVKKVTKDFDMGRKNLRVISDRLRNIRGLPTDPDSLLYRSGRVLLQGSAVARLGGVALASLGDVGRPVMKMGIEKANRQAFQLLTKGLKGLNISVREARIVGAAAETISNIRASQMLNLLEEGSPRSGFERGMEAVSSKIGVVALFSQYTDMMKIFTASIRVAEISDDLALTLGHTKGTAKELAEATKRLARDGIVDDLPNRIWKQLQSQTTGANENGIIMPNTGEWLDGAARDSYRAAMAKTSNDTIITPGVSQPKYMDASLGHRIITQFKSFAMETMNKTLVSGAQNANASVLYGSLLSLALGGVSWYARSMITGGRAQEDMQSADLGRWADEMIDRSGILGPLGIARDLSQHVPGLKDLTTFSNEKTSRTQALGAIGAIFGPSFDSIYTGINTLQGAGKIFDGDPDTQFKRGDLHKLRTLMPFQNVFYLRRLYDMLENSTANIAQMEGDPR